MSPINVIPARGGKVLRRAVFSALNLVPGHFGRYRVERCGPESAILSERIDSGQIALCAIGPGCLVFPPCENLGPVQYSHYVPSAEEVRGGYPIKRQSAIMKFLTGNPLIELGLWRSGHSGMWVSGRPKWVADTRVPTITSHSFGLTGLICSDTWDGEMVPLTLSKSLVAKTYIGGRSATISSYNHTVAASYTAISRVMYAMDGVSDLDNPVPVRARKWAAALLCGWPAGTITASPGEALAEIGLRPEIWNDETDPGGTGESAGDRNGARADDSDDDDDGGVSDCCDHCGDGCEDCQEDGGRCSECGRDLT